MWDWLDNAIDTVGDALGDAWDWVNDQVDTYIYDSGEGEAVVEKWVNDTVDTYIWDTGEGEAYLESWINDTFVDTAQDVVEWVDDAVDDIGDNVYNYYYTVVDKTEEIIDDAKDGLDKLADDVDDVLNDTHNSLMRSLGIMGESLEAIFDQITNDLGLPLLNMVDATVAMFEKLSDLTDIVNAAVNIDEETYVNDIVKMAELQEKATEKLRGKVA